jgi:hypothetical protein
MKHSNFTKLLGLGMAVSILAGSLPALAATTAINSFKVARNKSVADGAQYFSFSYDVANPGSDISVDTGGISTPIAVPMPGTMQFSGTVKMNAKSALFAIPAGDSGATINLNMTSNGKKSSLAPIYVFKPIKFDTDIRLALTKPVPPATTPVDAQNNETLLIKQGEISGQSIYTEFAYVDPAAETYLVLGNKEFLATDKALATSVEALPTGTFKAFFRGYNYATADHSVKYPIAGTSYINVKVLAKPSVTADSIDPSAFIGTKGGRCVFSSKNRTGAGYGDVEIKWTGKNLTKLVLSVDGVLYNISSPNKTGDLFFQPDCLSVGVHKFQLQAENTSDYKVTGLGVVSVNVAP